MSRFLKFIVNLIIVAAIIVAGALLIPPFAGIDTVMNDNSDKTTNLPVGTVAYGKATDPTTLVKGDRILYTNSGEAYVYEIADMDATAGIYKVKDIYNEDSETQEVQLINSAVKTILVVPYIAFAAIFLQSKEGLIVVGLGILFLIILFILSELWRKDDDDEDEDEEEEDADDGEEKKLSRKERKRLKKEEKKRKKLAKKGLLPEEKNSEEVPTEEVNGEYDTDMEKAMASIAEEIAKVEIESELAEMTEPELLSETKAFEPELFESEVPVTEEVQVEETTDTEEEAAEETKETPIIIEETPQEEISQEESSEEEMESATVARDQDAVLPSRTVKELLAEAEKAGEHPVIIEDEDMEITLLDYSGLI